jgi:hypothetical protein
MHTGQLLEHPQDDMLPRDCPVAQHHVAQWLPCILTLDRQGDYTPFNGFIAPLKHLQNVAPAQLTTNALTPEVNL